MYFTKPFVSKLFKLGILFTVILVLLDFLTYFFYPGSVVGKIFLATREQTPLTWVSVVVLLFIGLSCASIYMKTKKKVWYFLSATFLFFSIDDASYFHERFSGAVQEIFPLLGTFPTYSWMVLYMPLLVFGLGGLLLLLWRDASKKYKKLLGLAVFLLVFSLFLDILDGLVGKNSLLVFCINPVCDANITHILRLSEEVLEVMGFGLLAYLSISKHGIVEGLERRI